jgi:hypothetical protein
MRRCFGVRIGRFLAVAYRPAGLSSAARRSARLTFVETGIRHPPEPAADDEVATVWRRQMASNFRCGLAAGFFAVVSLAAFLPEIGITISFWPAAALRGFLADVEFRRHLTRPADGEHSSGCDERRGSRKFFPIRNSAPADC